jgi:hypothetical protein
MEQETGYGLSSDTGGRDQRSSRTHLAFRHGKTHQSANQPGVMPVKRCSAGIRSFFER